MPCLRGAATTPTAEVKPPDRAIARLFPKTTLPPLAPSRPGPTAQDPSGPKRLRLHGKHPDAGGVVVDSVTPKQVGQAVMELVVGGLRRAATRLGHGQARGRRGAAPALVLDLGVGV